MVRRAAEHAQRIMALPIWFLAITGAQQTPLHMTPTPVAMPPRYTA